jgi:hypothetical protein
MIVQGLVKRSPMRLHPHLRDAFLKKVASELSSGRAEIGPGDVHRVIRKIQSQFFDPPLLLGE